ncbi:MAG TPA: AAA family ATPase [Noviherbaspirillum sp.]|jgi:predicted kinase|uniref:AAA family ATPase n=1 Tax=Noviherbaspirillum sp. TaxID=1926288 RepID=UPI002F935863
MEAILLIGIQGAGKSTFYIERFFDTHLRIGQDLLGTRHRQRRLLEFCIETRQPFVVDKTNATRAERMRFILPSMEAGFRVVGYFFEPDPQGSWERNQRRKRQVPPAGLFGTLKRLERPQQDEGYSALHRVSLTPDGGFIVSDYAP